MALTGLMISGCATNLSKFPLYHVPERPVIKSINKMDKADAMAITDYVVKLEQAIKKYEMAAKEFNK